MKLFRFSIYIAVALLILGVTLLYLYNFHYGLSSHILDWSGFGSFFNGLLTPLLAIVNIIVLVELTIKISNIDNARTKSEIKAQKELLIIQLRKQSIESFCHVMSQYFDSKYVKEDMNRAFPYVSEYLDKFIAIDLNYFDFGAKNDDIKRQISALKRDFIILHFDQEDREKRSERYVRTIEKKDEIIKLLQYNALEFLTNEDK